MAQPEDVHGLLVLDGEDARLSGARYAYQTDDGVIWVDYEAGATMVSFTGTWTLPEVFTVFIEFSQLPYTVKLRFRVRDGEPFCEELSMMPERRHRNLVPPMFLAELTSFTSDGLRRLPIGRLQRLAILAGVHTRDGQPHRLEDWADLYADGGWEKAPRRKPGERLDESVYERVAATYRRALGTRNPTAAVKDEFHVSRSTAGRWVGEARRRGHLGKTTPGRMAK